jgi:subtilisin family serine protease
MKKILFLIYISLIFKTHAQDVGSKDYYWYNNQKMYLSKLHSKKWLQLTSKQNATSLVNTFPGIQVDSIDSFKIYFGKKLDIQNAEYSAYIRGTNLTHTEFEAHPMIKYVGDFFQVDGQEVILSYFFFVKLKSLNDITLLDKMAKEHHLEILEQNEYLPEWFSLACTKKSTKDALGMANLFYESTLFASAQPNFFGGEIKHCVSDPLFPDQWNLTNNYTSPDIDIDACEAWQYTKGNPEVIVAVIDEGIEQSHVDLNMHINSYDCKSGVSPSQLYGRHGTNCAGIIGAHHNDIGVSGIAPLCRLMSISDPLQATPTSRQNRARGIEFAWRNGADVISNSWGSSIRYKVIDDAIENALRNGRGGKGCVVVFSSGNYSANIPIFSPVIYPANSNPNILTVGAISTCGDRLNTMNGNCFNWGQAFITAAASCYGSELDIVAPGIEIPTTDLRNSFIPNFSHTSSAAPHAAGVAALMISINGNLTQKEVNAIIERTAKKTGGYPYFLLPNRPQGTWHDEMGYGLLNAHDAVTQSICNPLSITNVTFTNATYQFGCRIYSEFTNLISGPSLFEAKSEVILNHGFEVSSGMNFEVSLIGM